MKIELTEKQAQVVIEALDHYSRMGMGQLEDVGHLLGKYFHGVNSWDLIDCHLKPLKITAFPNSPIHRGGGSWGITNQQVPEPFRIAYEIQQVMRGDEHPLKITKEPLAKIIDSAKELIR